MNGRFFIQSHVSPSLRLIIIRFLIPILGLLSACVTPFDFSADNLDRRVLVVSGNYTNEAQRHQLLLQWATRYGRTRPDPIDNAQVTLFEDGQVKDTYSNLGDGIYDLPPQAAGTPGRTYHIEIELNNTKYRSTPTVMPQPVAADSLSFELVEVKELNDRGVPVDAYRLRTYLHSQARNGTQNSWLRWRAEQDYMILIPPLCGFCSAQICYVNLNVDNQTVRIFDGEENKTPRLDRYQLVDFDTDPLYKYYYRSYMNIYQYSMTPDAYRYWKSVQQLVNPQGTPLDPPPAPINSNIVNIENEQETVLGYFEVSGLHIVRTFATRTDLGNLFVFDFCGGGILDVPFEACTNCLLVPNSSSQKPDYWQP